MSEQNFDWQIFERPFDRFRIFQEIAVSYPRRPTASKYDKFIVVKPQTRSRLFDAFEQPTKPFVRATPSRFSSFEFRDSIHLSRGISTRATRQSRRIDVVSGLGGRRRRRDATRRRASESVYRATSSVQFGHVLPILCFRSAQYLACGCDACSSEPFDLLMCYVNVHGVQADDQDEVNT